MTRLTYKLDECIKTKFLNYEYGRIKDHDIMRGNLGRITDDMIFNKLGKLEDIEDELGIDLEILYKVLKSENIWIKKHIGAGKFRIVEVNIRGLNINKYTNEITIRDENNSLHILNGYGKTFALTREELEDD